METRQVNLKRAYSKIAKYGGTTAELAEEYGMTQKDFIERMKKGLETKLFIAMMKADERNTRMKICNEEKFRNKQFEQILVGKKKESNMKKANANDIAQISAKNQMTDEDSNIKKENKNVDDMTILESNKSDVLSKILSEELILDEANKTFENWQKKVVEAQKIVDEAKEELAENIRQCDISERFLKQHKDIREKLKSKLAGIEHQITDLKNNTIYLVAPCYKGEKPKYGKFYSTEEVDGFDEISIRPVSEDFMIEPELKDMIDAGYDSYKEYMSNLRFVMLCAEYTCNSINYSLLVSDDCLNRLLEAHVG